MYQHIAKIWADALAGGRFTQGSRYLTSKNNAGVQGDCCLGVLCKLALADGVPLTVGPHADGGESTATAYDRSPCILPGSVIQWAGMSSGSGRLASGIELTFLNDHGLNFKGIAEIVREHYTEL